MQARLVKILLASLLCTTALPVLAASEEAVNGRMSANWSGYVATRQAFTGVGATWVVPALSATTTLMTDVAWVGIGGSRTKDLIQAGTHSAVQNGKMQYWAWYELLPDYQQVIPLAVSGGDKVDVSIVEVGEDLWFMTFINITTGQAHYKMLEYNSRYSSAEWIQEMPVVYDKEKDRLYAPLSEFGSVTFEDAWTIANGKRLSLADARARAVTMVAKSNKKITLATPSMLLDEYSFVVTRSNAVPSPMPKSKRDPKPWEIVWSK